MVLQISLLIAFQLSEFSGFMRIMVLQKVSTGLHKPQQEEISPSKTSIRSHIAAGRLIL
jgi:hypothetical protein